MNLDHRGLREVIKHFSYLPFEQWNINDLNQFSEFHPHLKQLKPKNNYDLLIYFMEFSFGLFVEQIESKLEIDAQPSELLYTLALTFVQVAHSEPDAYRIAFLIRPSGNEHEHLPVESAIRFRVLVRKLFRLLNRQYEALQSTSIELQMQGLMCVLNGIVVSTLSLQRMELIEFQKLSQYIISNYLSGIAPVKIPSYSIIDK